MRALSLLSLCSAALLLALCLIALPTHAVDRAKFRRCASTDFCQRLRSKEGKQGMGYRTEASSVNFDSSASTFSFPLTSSLYPGQPALDAKIVILNDGIVRFTVNEVNGKYPRYPVQDVLQAAALRAYAGSVQLDRSDAAALIATWSTEGKGDSYRTAPATPAATVQHRASLRLSYDPFVLTFSVDDTEVLRVNADNLLHFEQYRERNPRINAPVAPVQPNLEGVPSETAAELKANYERELAEHASAMAFFEATQASAQTWPADTDGAWSESFGGHTDNKERGPAAVGLDVTWLNAKHLYGIPEHASDFALKNTASPSGSAAAQYDEPYRLYNLDVFEYELDEPMALYGAVPYLLAHTVDGKQSTGCLWLNAAETYVDVSQRDGGGLFGGGEAPSKRAHWMSETGLLDALFVLGPKPSDTFRQYTALTGAPFLPPQFSLAYHQCRWNYKTRDDALQVDQQFDEHDLPYDVLWLDIEHTDAKKYFTWDRHAFPEPESMQRALSDKGRRMVNIVDPHIKRDQAYHVHTQATNQGHYVKKKDGADYDGWCWPGSSSYLDFFQARVRDFWAKLFSFDSYAGSTPSLFIWNDMNEPSVFNGPEVTMPKDNLHRIDVNGETKQVEHREVHNQYGMYVHMATAQGLLERSQGQARPFVLTRAFFAGSQRTAAVWTGDNAATWSHLRASTPMLLSLAVGSIPFSGADVGGFFGDPDAQLLTRWYQAGAWQPFFRAHAHIDTKRREPYLFGEPYTSIIREALRTRYAYLPFFYTLFYRNTLDGMPIMRPLWVEFPSDPRSHGHEDQFLVGDGILVRPVVEADATSAVVYLPQGERKEVWYDLQSDAAHAGGSDVNVQAPLQHIPVFQRGGSIIPKRERARRSSALMRHDPYTLVVALSPERTAEGSLFIDDTTSFAYQNGAYYMVRFTLRDGVLSGKVEHQPADGFIDRNTVERIVLLGAQGYTQASVLSGTDAQGNAVVNKPLQMQAANSGKRLIIRKPDLRIAADFQIQLQ